MPVADRAHLVAVLAIFAACGGSSSNPGAVDAAVVAGDAPGAPLPDAPDVKPCGNGTLDPGEACDTAIATGDGACPTRCDDGVACTQDALVGAGTCAAHCETTPIPPTQGDGLCCRPTANSLNDGDCGVAFRFTQLTLLDPHAFTTYGRCTDLTAYFNHLAAKSIAADDGMGSYQLSLVLLLDSPSQAPGSTTSASLFLAKCSTTSTTCTRSATASTALAVTIPASGPCLAVLPETLSTPEYRVSPKPTTSPCLSSAGTDVTLVLGSVRLALADAHLAAAYAGDPATGLVDGLVRGFLSQEDARGLAVPMLGGTLNEYFPGDPENCQTEGAVHANDMDVGPSGEAGWFVYAGFTATKVAFTP